jgi:2-desacetyl-2-hydroxyethyl bacteriochlorophyllide A dehydrogenase
VRAVVVTEDRRLEEREVDTPEPEAGQVRVRVEACGICGSDLHMLPSPSLPPGAVMGHEFAGVIDAVGDGVEGYGAGDRVCVYPFRPVDHHDLQVALETGLGMSEHPGAYAEAVIAEQSMLWRLPEGMGFDQGALVEPLAVALHALNVSECVPTAPAAVIGAGPIGVMTAVAVRARGGERIVVIEKNERRRARAEALGFPAVGLDDVHMRTLEELGGEAPRTVFECAGNPAAPNLAIELVAASGCVVLLGVLEEPVAVSQLLLMLKEAQIRSSFAYRPSDFDEALALIQAGQVPTDELITGREPLARAQECFDDLLSPETEHLKVLLMPST